ncbi:hypothetical protein SteCoe_11498 [Stentor coeruleus]|uniref:EF-hand domain-containing protein n=1 Tax=Stentor coeruleus TaxID=5963 RepID=A0A1R2CCY4_9CILI|nr:hypothetical protein SteCoe_11498 [Stentor coeruleus]
MEVPENIYNWLKSTGLFHLTTRDEIPADLIQTFESGHAFTKLIKRLNQLKNKLDRLSTPLPEINTLKQALTPAAKLYNWNILSQALQLFNINLDPDTKSLIIGGDREMLIEVLNQLYEAELIKSPQKSLNKQIKPVQNSENGLDIDNIDDEKSLEDSESCLEFLILSFCHNFSLKPKQGAGLLAQGCKFLAHIVAKGLKNDFEPVRMWLQEIYNYTSRLTELIVKGYEEGSLQFVMGALKPGILSKDQEVVELTFTIITKLALDLSDKFLSIDLWNWFIFDSILELCMVAIKRFGLNIYHNLLEMLLHVSQNNYLELFTVHLRNIIIDPKEYIQLIDEFLGFIIESKTTVDEICNSGVVGFWIDFGNKEAEVGRPGPYRAVSLNFVIRLVMFFFENIRENESLVNSVLGLINRNCRDESIVIKTMAISNMFILFEFLSDKNSTFAAIVYRTLTFLLVENYSQSDFREFILSNFALIFKQNSNIPPSVLLDPLIKKMQVNDVALEVFDYDFISIMAQYPRLGVKHSIMLIDISGKVYLNDFVYSKAAGVSYSYIASRFIEQEPMQEYLLMFCKYGMSVVLNTENSLVNKNSKNEIDFAEAVQQRNRILDMISWIIQQWQDGLNEKIKENLLENSLVYYETNKKHSKAFIAVLGLFGDPIEFIDDYISKNKPINQDPITEIQEASPEEESGLELVLVSNLNSKALFAKKKGNFPWERAAEDIEKAKKKKQEKDQKLREEENKKKKTLELEKKRVKQQLEIRKLEQGVGKFHDLSLVYDEGVAQKLVIIPDEIQLREFTQAEADQLEAVNMMILKFSRVFKVLFNKYSGTGFVRKAQNKSEFDLHADRKFKIFDGEYIKIMKDHNVIPSLLSKTELQTVMRTYNHKIAKQAEQSYVDYESFKGVFTQLAYYIFSKKGQDYSYLPPVVSIKLLLDHMKNSLKSKGFSTELYDEPDPGTGDKDVVKSLNKMLAKDPNIIIPEGYKRIVEKDVKVTFQVPDCLNIKQSYKYSIEILDSILANIGIRLLEPQVEYFTIYRAKGIGPKNDKKREPSPLPVSVPGLLPDIFGKKKKKTVPVAPPVKLSPKLKTLVNNSPNRDREIYEECAGLLEDILRSVQLNMKGLPNRRNKIVIQEEKFENKREKEKKDDDGKKADEERKRKLRQQHLLEELNRAKEERQQKLKQEEERRKYEMRMADIKKREIEEKTQKERKDKARKLEEWNRKKDEELERVKEEEEYKKRVENAKPKDFEEAKRRNQERLDELLNEKKQKIWEQKNEEAKKALLEQEIKEKKRQIGLQKIKDSKYKEDKNEGKREELLVLSNPEVKNLLINYSQQLDCVFTYYIGILGKNMPADGSLPLSSFEKFSSQFNLLVYTKQDEVFKMLKSQMKKKSAETLTFDEFKNVIALIANRSKQNLGITDIGKALNEILNITGLNGTVKSLKIRLKNMNPVSPPKRKRVLSRNMENKKQDSRLDIYEKLQKAMGVGVSEEIRKVNNASPIKYNQNRIKRKNSESRDSRSSRSNRNSRSDKSSSSKGSSGGLFD